MTQPKKVPTDSVKRKLKKVRPGPAPPPDTKSAGVAEMCAEVLKNSQSIVQGLKALEKLLLQLKPKSAATTASKKSAAVV
jgi:hypothetical protein